MKTIIALVAMAFSTNALAEEVKCNLRSTINDTRIQMTSEAAKILKLRNNRYNEGVWVVCNEGEAAAKFKGEVFFASEKIMRDFRTQFIEYKDGSRTAGRDSNCDSNINIKIQRHKDIVEGLSFKVIDYCKVYTAKAAADSAKEAKEKAAMEKDNARYEADVSAWLKENSAQLEKTEKYQEFVAELSADAKLMGLTDDQVRARGRAKLKEIYAQEIQEWVSKHSK